MAKNKKETKKSKKTTEKILFESDVLPQNLLLVGENDKDKKIYIKQDVYKEIHTFASNKTKNEAGGLLIGTIIEEFSKQNIVIQGFVEAKYTEATPTTLTFTHETWDYCHNFIDDNYENAKIVGWIHTHPNFGIFLSEYDMFIQENFFRDENEIAYVVDPIQGEEGFFCWKNDKVVRTDGFFIYDEVGEEIDVDFGEVVLDEVLEDLDEEDFSDSTRTSSAEEIYAIKKKIKRTNIATVVLAIATVLLMVACFVLSSEVSTLKSNVTTLTRYLYYGNSVTTTTTDDASDDSSSTSTSNSTSTTTTTTGTSN